MKKLVSLICMIGCVAAAFAEGESDTGKMHWLKGGHLELGKTAYNSESTTHWLDETRFGIEAGSGFSKIFASNLSQKSQPNGSVGLYLNNCYGGMLFETGLRWQRRSYELTGFLPQYAPSTAKLELNPQYLEVPVMAGAMFRLDDLSSKKVDVRLGLKLGAYVAVGIAGDGTYYGTGNNAAEANVGNVFKRQSLYGGALEFDPMKRVDVGGKFGVDLYINRWKVGFEYTRGWTELSKSYDRHLKTKSFDFKVGFTLGYRRSAK